MNVILTHPNADFDAVAALLAAHKLYPENTPILPDRLNRNVHDFLLLYRNGLPFSFHQNVQWHNIDHIVLVDTQRITGLKNVPKETPTIIIDHHHPYTRADLKPHETFHSEKIGSTTTLLVEQLQQQSITLTSLEATLLQLGIYEDTGSLSYGTTTPRDIRAAAWLVENHAALDTVRRFLAPPLQDDQQALFDYLMNHAESRSIQGHTITVGAATIDQPVAEISSVVHRLRDTLDPAAIFVLVQMPSNLLLVCRATGDILNVGAIARIYGGGGHQRAAAATIYDQTLAEVMATLWDHIYSHVQPIARVADLMSYGVQTVNADQMAHTVAQQVRKIGHEGYPVIDQGRVVGLLTRRELDRTLEHGLGELTLREIMTAGDISLRPEDSVQMLEQTMVKSGWGQIPVVDAQSQIIGIVTRTDLINHWAKFHPAQPIKHPTLAKDQIHTVLGPDVATLIESIASQAQHTEISLYMVGGVVRDLMLNRINLDIDFVVEGSALQLTRTLQQRYGGDIHSYQPFGTAKWLLDDVVAAKLAVNPDNLPHHVDFATARNEFYEHPTALPTVYEGSIKLDLQRRDFTINTLAVRMSPTAGSGQILDLFGGMNDLQQGIIRALHSLSFVDDPTRILRALRFEGRLDFEIEARTGELIKSARPMLRRITGERIRNELDLVLQEPQPARILLRMQARGLLTAIHPAFTVPNDLADRFEVDTTAAIPWQQKMPDRLLFYWHIIATTIVIEDLPELCERLLFGSKVKQSLLDAAQLVQNINGLSVPDLKPSEIVQMLAARTEVALFVAWILSRDSLVRERIQQYMTRWRYVEPTSTGHDLRNLGITPGPCYGVILDKLRVARLDGKINTDEQERDVLSALIAEECS